MSRELLIPGGSQNEYLVRTLAMSGARFLIIGGVAVKYHCPERPIPSDLDLWIEPAMHTATRVCAVFASYGVNAPAAEELAKPGKRFTEKRTFFVDIFTPGPEFKFSELWDEANEVAFKGAQVKVASKSLQLRIGRASKPTNTEEAQKNARDIALLGKAIEQDDNHGAGQAAARVTRKTVSRKRGVAKAGARKVARKTKR